MLRKFFKSKEVYEKPFAELVEGGLIRVTGSTAWLQRNMHTVYSGGTWEKIGYKEWLFHLRTDNIETTRHIVESINLLES